MHKIELKPRAIKDLKDLKGIAKPEARKIVEKVMGLGSRERVLAQIYRLLPKANHEESLYIILGYARQLRSYYYALFSCSERLSDLNPAETSAILKIV